MISRLAIGNKLLRLCVVVNRSNFSVCKYVYTQFLPNQLDTQEKFVFPSKTHSISDISSKYASFIKDETKVTFHGWLESKPKKISKKLVFAKFRDQSGSCVQLKVSDGELIQKFGKFRLEDALVVTGQIHTRVMRENNEEDLKWEFKVEKVQLLNHANVVAAQLESLKKTSPFDFPPEYRYLQLRQAQFQEIMKKRSLAANTVRQELINNGFVEIETPLLFKSTPEGAREFLVPTRRKNVFYALPQSPQQYKQLLMASGVPKYFQIAKCFRDEDLRADRQPEFTQIDMEMAFATAHDVQETIEKLICALWKTVNHSTIYVPVGDSLVQPCSRSFPHLSYIDALTHYGIDKPDLRSTLKFVDLSEYVTSAENPGFPVVEACVLKGAGSDETAYSTLANPIEYKLRKPEVIAIKTQEDIDNWHRRIDFATFDSSRLEALKKNLDLAPGDIIACSTRAHFPYENPTPLGRFRQLAIKAYPAKWRRRIAGTDEPVDDSTFVASWVDDFPLFNPGELEDTDTKYPMYIKSEFVSTHHPFTMLKLEDYQYLENKNDFLKIKGDHYDLVINGVEVGGGSRRIHDPVLQNYIFKTVLKINNPETLFGHLLKAFDLGCPPHAGLAIGFDRLVAMLLGHSSIKNVIAFPKNQSGSDLVVNSPSKVSDDRLKEYKIRAR